MDFIVFALALIILIAIAALTAIIYILYKESNVSGKKANNISRERSSALRGEAGEMLVSNIIGQTIPNAQYVLNNYLIQGNGFSTQIDHILINSIGVFVIETKNYSGQVYGDDTRKEWTQVLNYGKVKNSFYSPVQQNAVHVKQIQKLIPDVPVFSLVVFVQNNTQNISSIYTIPVSKLKWYISYGTPVLDNNKMYQVYTTLLQNQSFATNEEHVAHIKEKAAQLSNGICPRCGGVLVMRNGSNGMFYGCSNYPKCKFKHSPRPISPNNNYNFPTH